MKLISWNVNGLRACIQKGFLDFFHETDADIFCIQESKLQEGQIDLPLPGYFSYWNYAKKKGCNGVQREHNKKLNNGLPILHKVPPKRDYGRYFCIMAEKGGTSHGGLTEKLSPFFHAKKQEVNAYGR